METRQLSDLEAEFIDAVRNYKRAYPNGSAEMEWYIQGCMTDYSKENEPTAPGVSSPGRY